MKLDRNKNPDGRGKYAIIQLRKCEYPLRTTATGEPIVPSEALEWGSTPESSFFVLRAKDQFAILALNAYRHAVLAEMKELDDELALIDRHKLKVGHERRNSMARKRQSLREYAADLTSLLEEWSKVKTKIPD